MKTKKLLLFLGIILMMLIVPSIVNAADSTVTLQDLSVTSPESGTYKTGQVITIVATFSDTVVGEENYVPTLRLKFGASENYGDVSLYKGNISDNKITYTYTITETDSGTLSLKSFQNGSLKDEAGNSIDVVSPSTLSGNTIKANPIVWTDTSNAKFSVDSEYNLNISGITELSIHSYCAFITSNQTQPTLELDEYSRITNHDIPFLDSCSIEKFLAKNGDIYYWLCEEQMNYETGKREQKFIISAKKIERPALKNLGSRMKCFFFSNSTSTFLNEPNVADLRNIKLKIGTVTDNSILLAIKNNESNALSRLLAYAKSANSIYTGTVPLGDSDTITANMNIVDDAYYYVYMVLDDENGKYYPVEDISLYQGLVGDSVGKNLFDYLDGQFSWNIDEQDYFSDFSEAKATIESLSISESTADPNNSSQKLSFAVTNVKINTAKKHQFYYYISNSKDDVPSYDSNLWKKADKVVIDDKAGTCYISTGNILDLSYADKLNLSVDTYISIYEVIDDKEIDSETISGTYKLGLNAKKISLTDDEPVNNNTNTNNNSNTNTNTTVDDTVANTKIPQTGESVLIISLIALFVVAIVVCVLKIRKYNF